jgi:hypothetical protein
VLTVVRAAGGGGGGNQAPLTEVKLTDKTKIELTPGFVKELNRKLKVGDVITVTLEEGVAGAVKVIMPAADVMGRITAISADGKTLTLESPPQRRGDSAQTVSVKITDKTHSVKAPIRVGEAGEALQPQVGLMVEVFFVEGSKDVAAALVAYESRRLGAKK